MPWMPVAPMASPADLDHPPHVLVRLAELLQHLDLVVERDRHPPAEVSRHLHVGEPWNEARRVAVVRRDAA